MTRIFAYIALLVILLTCSATTILAQGSAISEVSAGNFFGVGGRAVGMSEAVVVSSLDGTAIVYNPAALVRIMRPEFYAGLSNEKVSNSSSYGSSVARNDFSKTRLSSLNLAVPVPTYRGSFVVAFGVNRTMSFDRTYTFLYPGLNGSEKALEEGNGGIREWSAAAAVELSPRVSVGATLTYFHGSEDYYWDYSSFVFNDTGGDPPSYSLRNVDNIKSRYSAIGARLGMIVEANPYLSFGFMVESPKRFNVKQDYIQRTVLNGNLDVTPGSYEYVLQHPYSTMLAVQLKYRFPLTLELDAGYTDWRQLKYVGGADVDSLNRELTKPYTGARLVRIGAEYVLPRAGLVLRCGFKVDVLPLSVNFDLANLIEKNRRSFSFGVGYLIDRIMMVDIAYVHTYYRMYDFTRDIHEKFTSDKVMASVGYRI